MANKNQSPYFSIIIPIFNSEEFLPNLFKCLDNQVNKHRINYEILFIDNNSTDNSKEKILNYCKKNSKAKYFYEPLQGASAARNLGLFHAKGKYCIFLDADDTLYQTALNDLYLILLKENVDLVLYKSKIDVTPNKSKIISSFIPSNYENDFALQFLPFICGKVFKIEIIKKCDIKFPNIRTAEDIYFNFLFILNMKSFKYVDNTYYHYKYNSESLSHNIEKDPTSILRCMIAIEEYINENYTENSKNIYYRFAVKYVISDLLKISCKYKKQLYREIKVFLKSKNHIDCKVTNLFSWKLKFIYKIIIKTPFFVFAFVNSIGNLRIIKKIFKKL